jgi:hypothetical protein
MSFWLLQGKQVGKMAVDEPGTRALRMLAAATAIATHAPQLAVLLPRRGQQQQQQQQQLPGAALAAGGHQQQRPIQQHQHQQQQQAALPARPPSVAGMEVDEAPPTAPAPAAAAGAGREEDMDQGQPQEEEVILFQPRRWSTGRASRASDGTGPEVVSPTAAAAAAAGSAGGGGAAGMMHHPQQAAAGGMLQPAGLTAATAAAASAPPPLPQQLISSSLARHAASSAPSSPAVGQPRPTRHPVSAPAAGGGGGGGGFVSPTILPPGSQRAAAAGAGAGLLQGAAATALDLQQAQQASDALLARLQPKGPPAADPLFAAGGHAAASSGLNGTGVAPGGAGWDGGWGGAAAAADVGWGFTGHHGLGAMGGSSAAAGAGPNAGGTGHLGHSHWQGMDLHTRPPSPMAATSAAPPVVPSSSEVHMEGGWGTGGGSGGNGQPLPGLGLVNGGGTWGRDLGRLGSPSWALQQPGGLGGAGAAASAAGGAGAWGALQQQQQGAAAPISIAAASAPPAGGGAAGGVPPSWEGDAAAAAAAGVPLSASYRLEITAKAAAASILSPYKPDGEGDAAAAALVPELLLQQPGGGVPATSLTAGGPVRSLWSLPAGGGLDPAAAAAAAAAAAGVGVSQQQLPVLRLGSGGWPGASDVWGPAKAAGGMGASSAIAAGEEQPLKFIEYMGWQPGLLEAPAAEGGPGSHTLQHHQQLGLGLGAALPGSDGLRLPLAALQTHTTSALSSAHTTPRAVTPAGGGQPGTPGWNSGLGPPGSARTSHSGDIPLHTAPGSGSRRPSTAGAAPAPGAGGLFSGPELFGDVLGRGGGHHRRLSSGGLSGASGEEAPHLRGHNPQHPQHYQQQQQPWGHPGPSGLRTGSGGLAPGSPVSPLRGSGGSAPGAAVSSVLDGMGWAAGGGGILGTGRDMAAGGLSLGLASLAAAGGGAGAGRGLGLAVSGGGAGPVPGLHLEGSQPGVLLPPTDLHGPQNPFLS